jgi:hypothetical protein
MIEKGKILVHCDSAVGTCTCALGASDTSVCAHLAGESALVVVRASDSDDGTVLLHLDGAVRTGLCTKSATGAEARDDLCYAICDEDGVIGTSSCAVAKTDAGKGTNVFSLPMLCGIATGSEAVAEVLFILLGRLAGAVASNVSKELDGLSCLNSENVCDFLRSSIAAGNAEVGFGDLALGESTGIAVASAESASTAVSTGKSIADSEELFILLNAEKDVRNGKYDRANNRDRKTDKNGNKYCHNFLPPYARRFSTMPAKP